MNTSTRSAYASLLLAVSGCSMQSPSDNDYVVLRDESLTCTPPALLETRNWGKTGLASTCVVKDGPFVAAESGYIHLRGQYRRGREAGIWRWYDQKGAVVKEINYDPAP